MAAGDGDDHLELHVSAWDGDVERVRGLVERGFYREHINGKDFHGNTALHIAAHFGSKEIVEALVEAGANPECTSAAGWRPLDEAIASGSRECAAILMRSSLNHYRHSMTLRAQQFFDRLRTIPDFSFEIRWDFELLGGWVPSLVRQYVPNDVYRISKRGDAVRVDYTLLGFKNLQISRGKMSMVFAGSDQGEFAGHLFAIDHIKKTIQDFAAPPGDSYDEQIGEALDYLFAHDLCSYSPPAAHAKERGGNVSFRPVTSWLSSAPRTEMIECYQCDLFSTHGVKLQSLYRSDPDAKRTRIPRSFVGAEAVSHYRRLRTEYFSQSSKSRERFKDGLVWFGRENVRHQAKSFEGNLYVCEDFPLEMSHLMTLSEIYSPTSQQWEKLKQYLEMNLPAGYPVRIQIPVWWGITANVESGKFSKGSPPKEMFDIPNHYTQICEAYIGHETREMMKSAQSGKH